VEAQSVTAEHRERAAAYATLLPDIAALQAHGQHALVAACLGALARRRVADHVDGQRTLAEVAAVAQVDPLALRRMVRFLEPHGVFELADGRVCLTAKGRLLRSDSPVWSSLVLRGANDAAWGLDHSLATGQAAFPRVFGTDFWSFLAAHPDEQDAFADAMRLQAALLAVACVPALDLAGVTTVADLGGGTGDLLAAILEANPGVRGILVDRPEMLARAHPALRAGPLASRATLQPGDLFGELPAADAYVLAQVLHDWDDEQASRILRGLRRAAPPSSRVFILTLLVPEAAGAHPAKTADVGMMALFGGGRERTEAELRDLLASAGWRIAAVTPTRVASVIAATGAEPPGSAAVAP
jgi:O-methyltransferase domain